MPRAANQKLGSTAVTDPDAGAIVTPSRVLDAGCSTMLMLDVGAATRIDLAMRKRPVDGGALNNLLRTGAKWRDQQNRGEDKPKSEESHF